METAAVNPLVRICGILAPICGWLVGLAPYPTIQKIIRDRKVGNYPLLPYSSMTINCIIWFAYGILKREIRIWLCNGGGLIMGVYYFVSYVQFSPKASNTLPGSIQLHLQAILGILILTILIMILPGFDSPSLLGQIGVLFTILMFGSPLAALQVVIQTQDSKSIPLPFTLATLLNCLLWTVFGVYEAHDANITIPNSIGFVFGMVQLVLKIRYQDSRRGTTSRNDSDAVLPLTTSTSAPLLQRV